MTPASRIRALLEECQREKDGWAKAGNQIMTAACRAREEALKECLKIVEEG